MDETQMDIIDLIINMLKEHEAFMDKLSARMENTMKMIDHFTGHTLAEEKLRKLDEFVEFRKTRYEGDKTLGVHIPTSHLLKDLEEILQIIRT